MQGQLRVVMIQLETPTAQDAALPTLQITRIAAPKGAAGARSDNNTAYIEYW
jgi:hypothetical protein